MGAALRAPRADAQRSRAKILAAARALLATEGSDVALDRVAREAGVGNATLYRHFPTRAALLSAMFHDQTESLCAYAADLAERVDSYEALRIWLTTLARETLENTGLAVALRGMHPELANVDNCHDMIHSATVSLVAGAAAGGRTRPDVTAADLLAIVTGIALALGPDASPADGERLVEIFLAGMATRPDDRAGHRPIE